MKRELFAILVLAIALGSCTVVGTLNSLSEDQRQFVFKREMIGNWNDPKNVNERYRVDTIPASSAKLYTVEIFSHNTEQANEVDTLYFLGRLVHLGTNQFFDCKLDYDRMFAAFSNLADFTIAKHFVVKISFNGPDKMEVSAPDPGELIKLIEAGKVSLRYTEIKKDDYLILNSSTELQNATETLSKYPQVYKNRTELERVK